jgi:hypothetical protein
MTSKVIKGGYRAADGINRIYVGRPSPFGNPFEIGRDGTREEVIQKYREYFLANEFLKKLARDSLVGKTLCCFCAPLPCHADVIVEYLDSLRPPLS